MLWCHTSTFIGCHAGVTDFYPGGARGATWAFNPREEPQFDDQSLIRGISLRFPIGALRYFWLLTKPMNLLEAPLKLIFTFESPVDFFSMFARQQGCRWLRLLQTN